MFMYLGTRRGIQLLGHAAVSFASASLPPLLARGFPGDLPMGPADVSLVCSKNRGGETPISTGMSDALSEEALFVHTCNPPPPGTRTGGSTDRSVYFIRVPVRLSYEAEIFNTPRSLACIAEKPPAQKHSVVTSRVE